MDFEKTVAVRASPDVLWKQIINVERWPEMTPSMEEVRRVDAGELRIGSEARVKQPGIPWATWRVTELLPGRAFTWETRSGGVTTTGGHVVVAKEQGSSLTLTLRQHGPLAGIVDLLYGNRIRRYVSLEADGLRRAAEAAAGS